MPCEIIRKEVGVEWDWKLRELENVPGIKGTTLRRYIEKDENSNKGIIKRNVVEATNMSLSRDSEQPTPAEEKCETEQCQIQFQRSCSAWLCKAFKS